jgi:hypothetical protein
MEQGTISNQNGRPKGVPNRFTGTVREVLAGIIAAETEQGDDPVLRCSFLLADCVHLISRIHSRCLFHNLPSSAT